MQIPPTYFLTPKISSLLASIEASKQVVDSITIPPEIEANIRRQSSLKSSLYSARIEGNPLRLEEVTNRPSKDQKKKEVFNILKARNWVHSRSSRDITNTNILQMHGMVMESLIERENLGIMRKEVSAIYNTAGIAVYLTPRPSQIPSLIEKLIKYMNGNKEQFVPIRACLAHYVFEKIHPFMDGNGRVGRLLIQYTLEKGGYGLKGLLSVEKYLDDHRSNYYDGLSNSEKDVSDYLEFMLEASAVSADEVKQEVLRKQTAEVGDYLLPRRAEIYNIIRDHKLVNFDQLRRRFMAVNERTLRYDLKQLQNSGLIRKLGTTKGVYYEVLK